MVDKTNTINMYLTAAQEQLHLALVAGGYLVHQLNFVWMGDELGMTGVRMDFQLNDGPEMHQVLDFYGATLTDEKRKEWRARRGI